ncbi:GFA family protein [Flexibacterium corallicola]|uniref:GFA family protein n=1 Tax=Flexibacterium corallicola TaxID=3037259 RepID=UPI00286F2DB6|nr:GFA family protein [Pseudovibrio sp. M1P-2-3]
MTKTYQGSCLCKSVRYEVHGEFESFFLCHCAHCRKDTGSAHAANLFSTSASVEWICGQEVIATYQLPETRHARSFCKSCGSALPNQQMGGKLLVVPAGSLDTTVKMEPNAHIFMASKAEWDEELEHLPKLEGLPA